MARLTIEECWWTDPRRSALIRELGSEGEADACAIKMWRLAQEFWGRGRHLIPMEIFETLQAAPKLIQARLALVKEEGVYVKGSSQYTDWLNDKRKAGAAGGKKSAQRQRNAKGQLTKTSKQKPSKAQAEPKHSQPSGSGSGFDSGSEESFPSENVSELAPATSEVGFSLKELTNPVALWCSEYSRAFGTKYFVTKPDAKNITNFCKGMGFERLQTLFACYFAIKEPFYVNARHPWSLFMRDINKISTAAQTGVEPGAGLDVLAEFNRAHSQPRLVSRD